MIGIPSYYDQYFAADPDLERRVQSEHYRSRDVTNVQRNMDNGSYYYKIPLCMSADQINTMIENGLITPSKDVSFVSRI